MNSFLDQLKAKIEEVNAPKLVYCRVCQEPYVSDPLSPPVTEGYCTKTCMLMHYELLGVESGKIPQESYSAVQKEDMNRKVQQRVSVVKYYNNLLKEFEIPGFALSKSNLVAIKDSFEPLAKSDAKIKILITLTDYLITTREWYINEEVI